MKKHITILLILSISFVSFGQTSIKPKNKIEISEVNESLDIKILIELEKIKTEKKHLEKEVSKLERLIEKEISSTNEKLKEQKEDTKDLINIYVFFIGIVLALIGAAINFFGKIAIKKRVEQIIQNTAEEYAESKTNEVISQKVTDDYISKIIKKKGDAEIERLLNELKTKGNYTIESIKKKGNDIINSVWAAPPKHIETAIELDATDEEIKQKQENLRADEFFNLAFNTKDHKIRISLYENVLELEPENYNALNNIGVAYNDLYKFKKAIEYLSKAIKLEPNNSLAFANRANSYNQLDEFDLSISDANKSIELNQKNEWPYAIKGNVLTKQQKFIEAEEILNKSIELNPKSAVAYFNRGYFNEETKRYDESISDYLKAEELGYLNLAFLYNNLAVGYRRIKEFDKAISYIQKAREVNPDWPNLDGTMALIYSDKGDKENFYKFLKQALDKGCPVWNYLSDYAFDPYRNEKRLEKLIEPYKKNYYA
jgi:tetratricopeptide (TPR) repeat protein